MNMILHGYSIQSPHPAGEQRRSYWQTRTKRRLGPSQGQDLAELTIRHYAVHVCIIVAVVSV